VTKAMMRAKYRQLGIARIQKGGLQIPQLRVFTVFCTLGNKV